MPVENSPGRLAKLQWWELSWFYFIFVISPVAFDVLLHESQLLEIGAPNKS